jgi:streptogramin lyase
MWVGGFTGGVCKFDRFRMKFGAHRTRTYVKSFYEAPDGTLWAGTLNGLYKYDWARQQLTIFHGLGHPAGAPDQPSVSLESVWILALTGAPDGTLWLCLAGQGLIAFDPRTETYRQYKPDPKDPNSVPVDFIYDIWRDDHGILWLASWGGGLVRFDPASDSFQAFTNSDGSGLSSNFIYSLYPDPIEKHVLWVGTAKGGLDRFDLKTHKATSFRPHDDDPSSLSSDDVDVVYRQPDGVLWVGTVGGGLDRLDLQTGKAERFTTSNSKLTNNAVFGILPDDQGQLWMSTNGGGLLRLDPKTRKFHVYDASDGLQDNEFSQGASLRSRSGKLFFGGANGLNAFSPRDLTRDAYVPPVVITGFKVFNEEIKPGRPIWTLPPLEVSYSDSFEIEFAALSYAAPKKNRYAYKLEGFDDKFIETDRPFATYTKLSGGNYVLHVRAAGQDGAWNEKGVTLKLRVTPPFWRTWKAYAIYLLLLIGAAYLLLRWQRRRVREVEREGRLAVVERDLELTGAVQTGFLPENNEISTPQFQLVGVYKPADACGGDWWWHERMANGRHVVMVGDVTGHGPGPAMVTAAVATAFRVLTENGLQDVRVGLEMLNQEVLRVAKGKYHMTMAALELDEATGRWIFHSAGAPPILSLSAAGKHRVHFCPGAPLGTQTGFETGRTEGVLQRSDRLIVYTDGIPEIMLPNGNALGMRRFALNFERSRGQHLRDAAAAILGQAVQALGPQPQNDDWTFTLIEWG